MISALQQRQNDSQDEKRACGIFGNLREHGAGTRPEERIRATCAEGQNSAGFLFRKLDQNEEYEDDAVQHHRQGQ